MKIAFLADVSAKALLPPPNPIAVSRYSDFMQVLFKFINIYVFETKKASKLKDFERKKSVDCKKKNTQF